MSIRAELARKLALIPADKTLRFSRAVVPGRQCPRLGYRWQSVQTGDAEVADILLFMWNNRYELAKAEERGRIAGAKGD